jgi:hypothetical protein
VFSLFLGMIVSLLPKQYRNLWSGSATADFRQATILSGAVQGLGCLVLYIVRYFYFFEYRVGTIAKAAIKKGVEEALGSPAAQYGAGFTTTVEYFFSPLSVLLAYFAMEGVVRLFAAVITEETTGTLPLYVVAWVVGRVQAWRADRALGIPMEDEVHRFVRLDYDLAIASSRPKKWDRMLTIEFEEKNYELYDQKLGPAPRPYIYLLKQISPGWVIRGLHHYRPDENLLEKK